MRCARAIVVVVLVTLAACNKDEPAASAPVAAPTATTAEAAPAAPARQAEPIDLRKLGEGIPEQLTNRNKDSLFGGERGLDHVGVAVNDLAAAEKAYAALGFGPAQRGVLPNGIHNANFYFADTTYLELLTAGEPEKARDVADFLATRGPAAMFFVLAVFSYDETARFLGKRKVKVDKPIAGRIQTADMVEDARPMWHTFYVDAPRFLGDPFFFITYDRVIRNYTLARLQDKELMERAFAHRNKARGIHSVWIAVRDLDAARKQYEALGLTLVRQVSLPQVGASGVELAAGAGTVLLVRPDAPQTPASAFVAKNPAGILGLSIEVEKVAWARGLIQHSLKSNLPSYEGPLGPAILVNPVLAAGTYLELFERK